MALKVNFTVGLLIWQRQSDKMYFMFEPHLTYYVTLLPSRKRGKTLFFKIVLHLSTQWRIYSYIIVFVPNIKSLPLNSHWRYRPIDLCLWIIRADNELVTAYYLDYPPNYCYHALRIYNHNNNFILCGSFHFVLLCSAIKCIVC